ncbi:MAG TPA: MFS transporter [Anaerolineae bacterium]|nr:MFS transporter [Anaerolineae bacterium]
MPSGPSLRERSSSAVLKSRLLYFSYYMALGAFFPFITLYYERIGLSGVQIGTLSALPLIVTSSTSLLWGMLADTLRLHRRILSLSLLLSAISVYLISRTSQYELLIPIILIYAFFATPTMPLLDTAALDTLETNRGTFGGMRVWGTIGWMVSTWLVGEIINTWGLPWFFYSYIFLLGITFLVSLLQPTRGQILRPPLRQGLRQLLSRRTLLLFLLSVFLLAVTTGTFNYFFSLYMDGLGASEGTIGLAWSLSASTEIPVMVLSETMMNRIGVNGLLSFAFITYAIRWLLFSFIQTPGWVMPVQLLQGLSFATFLVASVTYINDHTPKGLRTTGQSLLSTISFGLGPIVGSLLGGYFYDTVGMIVLFRIITVLTIVGFGVFILATRYKVDPQTASSESQDMNLNRQ